MHGCRPGSQAGYFSVLLCQSFAYFLDYGRIPSHVELPGEKSLRRHQGAKVGGIGTPGVRSSPFPVYRPKAAFELIVGAVDALPERRIPEPGLDEILVGAFGVGAASQYGLFIVQEEPGAGIGHAHPLGAFPDLSGAGTRRKQGVCH